MTRYFYHLTTKESAKEILKNGLLPRIGERSQIVGEEKEVIFLADRKSVPYWKTLLPIDEKPVILRVDASQIDEEELEEFPYEYYTEYAYCKAIDPKWIVKSHMQAELTVGQYLELCLSYIDYISCVSVDFANYISYRDHKDTYARAVSELKKEDCIAECRALRAILPRLDFSCLTPKILREHLHLMGDGGFTLCDRYEFGAQYDEHAKRLWQLLGTHELATEETKWLYHWLKKTFPRGLRVDTGGWTG